MTFEEALEQLREAYKEPDDAYTTEELADSLGVCNRTVQNRLKLLKKNGRLEVVKVKRESLGGYDTTVRAYRILPGPENE